MTYRLDEDCELPPHLIELFLRTAPAQMQGLVEACRARDGQAARAEAHKLKGGLYSAGASRLAEDLELVRTTIAALDWARVESQLAKARVDFESVLAQLRAQLTGGESR